MALCFSSVAASLSNADCATEGLEEVEELSWEAESSVLRFSAEVVDSPSASLAGRGKNGVE